MKNKHIVIKGITVKNEIPSDSVVEFKTNHTTISIKFDDHSEDVIIMSHREDDISFVELEKVTDTTHKNNG